MLWDLTGLAHCLMSAVPMRIDNLHHLPLFTVFSNVVAMIIFVMPIIILVNQNMCIVWGMIVSLGAKCVWQYFNRIRLLLRRLYDGSALNFTYVFITVNLQFVFLIKYVALSCLFGAATRIYYWSHFPFQFRALVHFRCLIASMPVLFRR